MPITLFTHLLLKKMLTISCLVYVSYVIDIQNTEAEKGALYYLIELSLMEH